MKIDKLIDIHLFILACVQIVGSSTLILISLTCTVVATISMYLISGIKVPGVPDDFDLLIDLGVGI